LIGLHIYDEREVRLPNVGLIHVLDSETGKEQWVDTSNKQLRMAYEKKFVENQRQTRELFAKSGAQLESIDTEANYAVSLMNMFKRRGAKR
jgi:hypothetical protein